MYCSLSVYENPFDKFPLTQDTRGADKETSYSDRRY
jgi:hypothetical protein